MNWRCLWGHDLRITPTLLGQRQSAFIEVTKIVIVFDCKRCRTCLRWMEWQWDGNEMIQTYNGAPYERAT